MHDREQVYRRVWEHTDRRGMVLKSQGEMADILGIPYQRLSVIYTEFQEQGLMRKYRHKFQALRSPDSVDWKKRLDSSSPL